MKKVLQQHNKGIQTNKIDVRSILNKTQCTVTEADIKRMAFDHFLTIDQTMSLDFSKSFNLHLEFIIRVLLQISDLSFFDLDSEQLFKVIRKKIFSSILDSLDCCLNKNTVDNTSITEGDNSCNFKKVLDDFIDKADDITTERMGHFISELADFFDLSPSQLFNIHLHLAVKCLLECSDYIHDDPDHHLSKKLEKISFLRWNP